MYLSSFVFYMMIVHFFFFKQKTAYEMRISDWSSDVCSSDLQTNTLIFHECLRHNEFGRTERYQKYVVSSLHVASFAKGDLWGRVGETIHQIGRASCRERVCQYV